MKAYYLFFVFYLTGNSLLHAATVQWQIKGFVHGGGDAIPVPGPQPNSAFCLSFLYESTTEATSSGNWINLGSLSLIIEGESWIGSEIQLTAAAAQSTIFLTAQFRSSLDLNLAFLGATRFDNVIAQDFSHLPTSLEDWNIALAQEKSFNSIDASYAFTTLGNHDFTHVTISTIPEPLGLEHLGTLIFIWGILHRKRPSEQFSA